jgi:hypothetical protein
MAFRLVSGFVTNDWAQYADVCAILQHSCERRGRCRRWLGMCALKSLNLGRLRALLFSSLSTTQLCKHARYARGCARMHEIQMNVSNRGPSATCHQMPAQEGAPTVVIPALAPPVRHRDFGIGTPQDPGSRVPVTTGVACPHALSKLTCV